MTEPHVVIIGAGPAGLTAGYELARNGEKSIILEADVQVGGISKTVDYRGYKFDIGGHRFFSKVEYVNEIWTDLLGDDLLVRPRQSRIYYDGKFFDYPLQLLDTLSKLGPAESFRVGMSYARAQLFPSEPETTLEEWVSNRFGRRLFEIFFKTYTEKVWGIPCSEISSDWAAQRIKNLTLAEAIRTALQGSGKGRDGQVITTLIDRFRYPRCGPGMMWERCAERLAQMGSKTVCGERAQQIRHTAGVVEAVVSVDDAGNILERSGNHFISSMALRELVHALDPPPPEHVLSAARALRYRDYLTIVLIVDRPSVFPDNWIYIHEPSVVMGRIQNYKNWSPEMIPDPRMTSLGLEYFLWQQDDRWTWDDDRLVAFGTAECAAIGLIRPNEVRDGTVVRMKKAYPVYDHEYQNNVDVIRDYLAGFSNLQTIGRNGLHRYNNQDHSMMTGVLAARNIVHGRRHDVWNVNTEKVYHEEERSTTTDSGDRLVPTAVKEKPLRQERLQERAIATLMTRLDPRALGIAVGAVVGSSFFLMTVALLLKGGVVIGPNLGLLSNYLWGYSVSWPGAVVGLVETAIGGFALGYLIARLRNAALRVYLIAVRRRQELYQNPDILDKV